MACCLISTNPLSKPIVVFIVDWTLWKKFQWQIKEIKIKESSSKKGIWKCPLQNANQYALASMCLLTHCALVKPYGKIHLGQHWLRSWLIAWWHQDITWTNIDCSLIREVLWHSSEINSAENDRTTILCKEFENYTLKITATSPSGQRVKGVSVSWHLPPELTMNMNILVVELMFVKPTVHGQTAFTSSRQTNVLERQFKKVILGVL